jgi:lysyl-tRNA synthetase class 2
MAELASAAERWRGDEPERGFSMALGRLGDPADRRCVMVSARDADGVLRGLLSFVPWGRAGLSLDLMRRDPAADNGVVELMVCATVDEARRWGVRRISLNFAMFREVFASSERLGAGPVVRLTATALGFASRWWQIETLYRANAKFLPRWQPRYLCFADGLHLNRALIAAGIAEGQLPVLARRVDDTGPTPSTPELVAAVEALDLESTTEVDEPSGQAEQARRRKLDAMRRAGEPIYPASVERTASIADVRRRWEGLAEALRTGREVSVAGRVVGNRRFGRLCFGVLREGDAEIQVMLSAGGTGDEAFRRWKDLVDVGDQVSCTGEVVATRTGELTVDARAWSMAAKCLRPLSGLSTSPDRPSGVDGRENELLVDPDAWDALRVRSIVLTRLRCELTERSFTEVETPMLQGVPGGDGRQFTTHFSPLDLELFLRLSPELSLKRLRVAGVDRLFELSRTFWNEDARGGHPARP